MEEVLLLQHLGMLQAGRVSALPPQWDGPSPWGTRQGTEPWQLVCPAPAQPREPQQLPQALPCPPTAPAPGAGMSFSTIRAQQDASTATTAHGGHQQQSPPQSLQGAAPQPPGAPHTHPQHGDHGGVSETPILILEVVSLRPLVPLADLPQLHCLIWGGERRLSLPELP